MDRTDKIFDKLFSDYPSLGICRDEIKKAYELILNSAEKKATVMICGNGGSAADSEHIVGELMKGFNLKRPLCAADKERFSGIEGGEIIADKLQGAVRAVSLVSQSALISAFANDIAPELVFAQQVYAYAQKPEDVLIALSTSGNSVNVVNAAKTAKAMNIKTIALTGRNDSSLSRLCDVTVKLPAGTPYEVQELTLPVYHALCAMAESEMFAE